MFTPRWHLVRVTPKIFGVGFKILPRAGDVGVLKPVIKAIFGVTGVPH